MRFVVIAASVEVEVGELGAGGDVQLPEDVAEMEVDGARAQKELGRHLSVGETLRDEAGDLQLLRGQFVSRARIASACPLAARPELYVRALRPQRRLQRFEPVESRSQMLARLDPAPGTTQELAVGEFGPGAHDGTSGPGVSVECRLEEPIGLALVVAQQRAAVEERRTCPCGRAVVGPRLERGNHARAVSRSPARTAASI